MVEEIDIIKITLKRYEKKSKYFKYSKESLVAENGQYKNAEHGLGAVHQKPTGSRL